MSIIAEWNWIIIIMARLFSWQMIVSLKCFHKSLINIHYMQSETRGDRRVPQRIVPLSLMLTVFVFIPSAWLPHRVATLGTFLQPSCYQNIQSVKIFLNLCCQTLSFIWIKSFQLKAAASVFFLLIIRYFKLCMFRTYSLLLDFITDTDMILEIK